MANISVVEDITITIEAPDDENTVTINATKTDATNTDVEYANITVTAGTTVDIGSTTPSTLIGRIVVGHEVWIQTDTPVWMSIQTATEAIAQLAIKDYFLYNGDVMKIAFSSDHGAAHIKVVIAGTV